MPRDSNGTYSLPAGNPIVTLTTISSTWANTTLADIGTALTNSLDRAGSGGMTGQLKLSNGTIGAPGLSWSTETNSGLYRAGAGDFRYSVGSNDRFSVTAALFKVSTTGGATVDAGQLLLPDGTTALPAVSFSSDPDTGFLRPSANVVNVSTGNAVYTTFTTQGTGVTDGAVGTPALFFFNDLNTGLYRIGTDNLGIAAGGTAAVDITSGRSIFAGLVYVPDGSVTFPSMSFTSDTNTGGYRIAADNYGITCNGTNVFDVTTGRLILNTLFYTVDGTNSFPSISFLNDTNTGFFRPSADEINMTLGGTTRSIGFRGGEQRAAATPTLVQGDNGRLVITTSGNITVPALAQDTVITIFNNTVGNITLARSGIALYTTGTATDSDKTVPTRGVVTLLWFSGTTNVVASGTFS